jgi:hypothetical protein
MRRLLPPLLLVLTLPTLALAQAPPPAAAPAPAAPAPAAPAPAAPAPAAEPPPPAPAAQEGPVRVKVGIYVLSIGKFDVASGTYTVDFYISMTSVDGRDMGDARFEFMNGRATGAPDKLIDKPNEKFYRVQANLMTNVDLRRFPWDKHELPIIIESATRGKTELIYEIDEKQTGLDPSILFIGWDLDRSRAKGEVRDHVYEIYGETYSQVVFKLPIARLMFISSLKTFLPIACFLLISFVSLLATIDKLDTRVGMNTAMLIASVMFHLSISNQIPPAGYLTIADKVMIATYLSIGLNLFLSVTMMRWMQLKQEDRAKTLRERSFSIVPAVAAVSYLVAFTL